MISFGYIVGWILIVLLLLLLRKIYKGKTRTAVPIPPGKIRVPIVHGGWPIIGHAFDFYVRPIRFFKECLEKYGPAFVINIFGHQTMMICDHSTADLLLNAKDHNFSEEILLWESAVNFCYELCSKAPNLSSLAANVRSAVKVKCDHVFPVIKTKVEDMIQNLEEKCNSSPDGKYTVRDFEETANHCMTRIKYVCLLGEELTDQAWEKLQKFHVTFRTISTAHGFLPKPLLRWVIRHFVKPNRNYILAPKKKFLSKSKPNVARAEDEPTEADIGIMANLFTILSAEFSPLIFMEAIRNLSKDENAGFLKELREECETNAKLGGAELLQGSKLTACVMEAARTGGAVIGNMRKPMRKDLTLGDYFIGPDIDFLLLSPSTIMVHGKSASSNFESPTKFNPYRFLGESKESFAAKNVIAWGNGIHPCPARIMTIFEIKTAVAYFVLRFDFKVKEEKKVGFTMGSSNAVSLTLTKRV